MRQVWFSLLLFAAVSLFAACEADDPSLTPTGQADARAARADAEPDRCNGCVTANGDCRSGTLKDACGGAGESCEACTGDDTCEEQVCTAPPACSPDNCQGCCNAAGECVSGQSDAAVCGKAGGECTTCSSRICENGACKQECSATTCNGCCQGPTIDDCVELGSGGGQSDGVCGRSGALCTACAGTDSCTEGRCVDTSCSTTCTDGCCDGSVCRDGDTSSLCGDGGNSCVACGDGLSCSTDGVCVTDPASLWNFIVVSADVPTKDENGDDWDAFGGAPDVQIKVDLGNAPGFTGLSGTIDNQFFPVYSAPNGEVVVQNVPAEIILQKIAITFIDVDTFNDDVMNSLEQDALNPNIFNGSLFSLSTGTGVNKYTIRFKLVKN